MTNRKALVIATPDIKEAHAQAYEQIADIAAGQYWRAVSDISELKATHTTYGRKKSTNGRKALAGGTILLVTSLRHADGALHTIVMAPHPLEEDGEERRFLADEFFALFERAFDAQEVRRAEINDVERTISELQNQLVSGPENLPLLPPPARTPTLDALIAHADKTEELKKRTQLSVELAKHRADWVQEKVAALGSHTATLARFHQEQATAAIAMAEDTIRYANHLTTGIQTLTLYTGENVSVEQLVSGAPAPENEPLTLYQRKLYLDEEFLIHLNSGGADYQDIDSFAAALGKDPALLQRILPQPRSVVLMRYRRHDKMYFNDDALNNLANALTNLHLNAPNHTTFLLIRNGANVYQVWSDVATDDAPRLFPTREDLKTAYMHDGRRPSRYFDGAEAQTVTPDDLLYTEATQRHADLDLFYKRLLVLLWGLNDRLAIFGSFYDKNTWQSWLSLEFQKANFHFVHDDEDGLTESRPDFYQWVSEMNALAQPGSRIFGIWEDAMSPETSPGACRVDYSQSSSRERINWSYAPIETASVAILRQHDGRLVVDIPCEYRGWREVKATRRNIQIDITKTLTEKYQTSVICLDRATSADLDYYLNSRRQREAYLAYARSFFAARDFLRAEEKEAEPFVSEVMRALSTVPAVTAMDPDLVLAAVSEAIRLWRATARGAALPGPDNTAWKSALNEISRNIWRILQLDGDHADKVAQAVKETGRQVFEMVSRGNGKLYVYASPRHEETFPLGDEFPFACRIPVSIGKSGRIKLGESSLTHYAQTAAERSIHRWPEGAKWLEQHPEKYYASFEEVASIRQTVSHCLSQKSLLASSETIDDSTFNDMLKLLTAWTRKLSRHRIVSEPDYVVPIAIAEFYNKNQRGTLAMIMARCSLSEILWARADSSQRERLEHWFAQTYRHPEHSLGITRQRVKKGSFINFHAVAAKRHLKALRQLPDDLFISPGFDTTMLLKRPSSADHMARQIDCHQTNMTGKLLEWDPAWKRRVDEVLTAWFQKS